MSKKEKKLLKNTVSFIDAHADHSGIIRIGIGQPVLIPVHITGAAAAFVKKTATKLVSPENVIDIGPISTGEDFGMFLEKVPGVMALVGVGNEACGAIWPQHSSKYTVDEDALLNSVMLYAQVAYDHNAQ